MRRLLPLPLFALLLAVAATHLSAAPTATASPRPPAPLHPGAPAAVAPRAASIPLSVDTLGLAGACTLALGPDRRTAYIGLCNRYGRERLNLVVASLDDNGHIVGSPRRFADSARPLRLGESSSVTAIHVDLAHHKLFLGVLQSPSTLESLYSKKTKRAELGVFDLDASGRPLLDARPAPVFVDVQDAALMAYKPVFADNPIEAIVRHPTLDVVYLVGAGTNDGAHVNLIVRVSLAHPSARSTGPSRSPSRSRSPLAEEPAPVRAFPVAATDASGNPLTRYKSALSIASVMNPDNARPRAPPDPLYRLYLGTYHDSSVSTLHRCAPGAYQAVLEIVTLDSAGVPAPTFPGSPQESYFWGPCEPLRDSRSIQLRFDLSTRPDGSPVALTRRFTDGSSPRSSTLLRLALDRRTGSPAPSADYGVTPLAHQGRPLSGVSVLDSTAQGQRGLTTVPGDARLGWTGSVIFSHLVATDGIPFAPTQVFVVYGKDKLFRTLKQPLPVRRSPSSPADLSITLPFDEPDFDLANPTDTGGGMPWGQQHILITPQDDKGRIAAQLTATLTVRDRDGHAVGAPQSDTVRGGRIIFVLPTYQGYLRGGPPPESLAAHFERLKKEADRVAVTHRPRLFLTSFSHTRGGQGSLRELIAQREIVRALGFNTTEVEGWDGLGTDGTSAREFSGMFATATASVPYDGKFANRPFYPLYVDEVGGGQTYLADVVTDLPAAARSSACDILQFMVRTGSLSAPSSAPRSICEVTSPQVRMAGIGDEPNIQLPEEVELIATIPRRLRRFRRFVRDVACGDPRLPYRDSTLEAALGALVPRIDCAPTPASYPAIGPALDDKNFDAAWARVYPVPPSAVDNAPSLGLSPSMARRLVYWTAQYLFYEDALAFKALADELRRKTTGGGATDSRIPPGPGLLATLNIQGFQKYLQSYDSVLGAMRSTSGAAGAGGADRIVVQFTQPGGPQEAAFTVSRGAVSSAVSRVPPLPPQSVNVADVAAAVSLGTTQGQGTVLWYPPPGQPGLLPLLIDTRFGRFAGTERFEIDVEDGHVVASAGLRRGSSPWVALADRYLCSLKGATRACGGCARGLRSDEDKRLATTRTDQYACQDLRMLRPDLFAAIRLGAFNPSFELGALDARAEEASFVAAVLRSMAAGFDVETRRDRALAPIPTMGQFMVNGGSIGDLADGALYKVLANLGHGAKGFQFYGFGSIDAFGDSWGEHTEVYGPIAHAMEVLGRAEPIAWRAVPDRPRVAILMPNDDFLWDPWHGTQGYTDYYAKEPQGLYHALSHAGYSVDFLDDQDLKLTDAEQRGALERRDHQVLYLTGPNLSLDSARAVFAWMKRPGHTLVVVPGAATRNEYDEPLADPRLAGQNPIDVLLGLKPRAPHRELCGEATVWPPLGSDATLRLTGDSPLDFGPGREASELRGCTEGGCGVGRDNQPAWSFNFAGDLTPDARSGAAVKIAATLTTHDPRRTLHDVNAITVNRPNGNLAVAYGFFPGFQYLGSADGSDARALPVWSRASRVFATAPVTATPGITRPVTVDHDDVEALRLRWPDEREPYRHVAVVLLNWSGHPIEAPVKVKVEGLAGNYRVSTANDTPFERYVAGSGEVILKRLTSAEVILLETPVPGKTR